MLSLSQGVNRIGSHTSISNPTSSTVALQGGCTTDDDVNGSTSDSDANDDKQLLEGLGIAAAATTSGEVEHQDEDINLACSNVVRTYVLIIFLILLQICLA